MSSATQRTCRFVTLGCKVNQYETQLVKETLAQNGFREARDGESADLCVVNTCTVTATGDSKGRQAIRQLARANPGTQTIVMGCYATRDPKTVSSLPGVVEVVTDKRELPDVLSRFGIYDMPAGISSFDGRQRAFVKVQDGCILKCTYCIIPQVRPGLRSRDPQDIEDEVRRLIDNGYQEIVLSGIHVGHFGVETTRGKSGKPPFRLWHLFEKLDRIPGVWRMRLSSIEAAEIHDDFLKAARNCEHLCPHLHPALQSGSNAVLRRMRRRYSVERFLEKCERIREALPNAALTTDVIAGFPGETEDDFAATVAACRRAEFMKVHVFPFSAREGTPAAEYADRVAPDVLKARCDRLAREERALARRYYDMWVGHSVEVLIERQVSDRPNWVRGTDRRYVPVMLPGSSDDVGRLVTARAVQAGVRGLVAEPMFSNEKERADDSPGIPIDLCRRPAGRGNDDCAFPP